MCGKGEWMTYCSRSKACDIVAVVVGSSGVFAEVAEGVDGTFAVLGRLCRQGETANSGKGDFPANSGRSRGFAALNAAL